MSEHRGPIEPEHVAEEWRSRPDAEPEELGLVEETIIEPEDSVYYGAATIPERSHTVSDGEALFAIAAKYDAKIEDIIHDNGLKAPGILTEGQILKIR